MSKLRSHHEIAIVSIHVFSDYGRTLKCAHAWSVRK